MGGWEYGVGEGGVGGMGRRDFTFGHFFLQMLPSVLSLDHNRTHNFQPHSNFVGLHTIVLVCGKTLQDFHKSPPSIRIFPTDRC